MREGLVQPVLTWVFTFPQYGQGMLLSSQILLAGEDWIGKQHVFWVCLSQHNGILEHNLTKIPNQVQGSLKGHSLFGLASFHRSFPVSRVSVFMLSFYGVSLLTRPLRHATAAGLARREPLKIVGS